MAQPRGWVRESYRHRLARYGIQTSKVKSRKDRVRRKENLWMFKEYLGKKQTDPALVEEGAKVEMEHADTVRWIEANNPSVKAAARRIAEDHIRESKGYYPALRKMEAKLEKRKGYLAVKSDFVELNGETYLKLDDGTYMNVRNPNDILSDESGEQFGGEAAVLQAAGVLPWAASGAVLAEQYRPMPVYAARKYKAGMRPDVELEGNVLRIKPNPMFSMREKEIVLTNEEIAQFRDWQNGMNVQSAFPKWSPAKRELLLTGMDDAEFKDSVGGGER